MKTNTLLLILIGYFSFNLWIYGDSPLTSTDFSKAYQNEETVVIASGTKGNLTNGLMDWLASEENPVAVKMAIINRLGWDTENRNNSSMFFNYLKKLKGYRNKDDFAENGKDFELLCMAYLKAMENYFEVEDAIVLAEKAVQKNKTKSYTFNIISAMIKAQKKLGVLDEWCEVYNLTNRVREDKFLLIDINDEAINIIFNYMDLYKESCGN